MIITSYPTADQRRHWHRIELIGGLIVAALALGAVIVLLAFTTSTPLVAVAGVVIALDLPVCGYVIWRAARQDPGPAHAG